MPNEYREKRLVDPYAKFGVWSARTKTLAGLSDNNLVVGYKIEPSYNLISPNIYPTRAAAEAYLSCFDLHRIARAKANFARRIFDLPAFLKGRVIEEIEDRKYGDISIKVEGHERFNLYARTRYWSRVSVVTTPHEGPYHVKLMLKSQKAIRLIDGSSIDFDIRGKFDIVSLPQTIIDEVFVLEGE